MNPKPLRWAENQVGTQTNVIDDISQEMSQHSPDQTLHFGPD